MGQYLPPAIGQRWVVSRKLYVIEAIRNGGLSIEDACALYSLTTEEILSWRVAYERHGVEGLKIKKLQTYRAGGIKVPVVKTAGTANTAH